MPLHESGIVSTVPVATSEGLTIVTAIEGDQVVINQFYDSLPPTDIHNRYGHRPAECLIKVDPLQDENTILLARLGGLAGQIVGVGEYYRSPRIEPPEAELALVVSSAYSRRGFGSILLRSLVRVTADSGYGSVFLEVDPANSPMTRLARNVLGTTPGRPGAAGVRYQYDISTLKQSKPEIFS